MVAMGDQVQADTGFTKPENEDAKMTKAKPQSGSVVSDEAIDKYRESLELREFTDDVMTTTEEETESSSKSEGSSVKYRNPNHPIIKLQNTTVHYYDKYGSTIWKVVGFVSFVGYSIYLGFAINYSVSMATALIVVTSLSILLVVYGLIRDAYGDRIQEACFKPIGECWDRNYHITKWFLYPALVIALVLYLVLAVLKEVKQLQSLSGMVLFILFTYVTSKYPDRITWRPVLWGYSLQFIFAVLVLRWQPGYDAVSWCAEVITKFVNFAYEGAAVVFGDPWLIFHAFTFMGMPLLIYIGMVMGILYYYGVTQIVAAKLGWFFMITMGTTAIETLGVAANIFLNGMDTMLMLRVYLTRLTKSEFHCFLVSMHATVAGFAFALFVLFGAPPQHLLSAAVMSAPATIAIVKLNHPETEESRTHKLEDIMLARGDETNVFEAAANGAAVAGKTVAAVLVSYIAFLSLLAWINSCLDYLGTRVGYDELSFQWVCSYLFWPIALVMGVDVHQCREVAKIIGLKVICSEILGFQVLGESIRAGALNERSQAIATYAICGFSSLSTLAIAVGVWQAVCPSKVAEMTGQMLRSLTNANMSCFMTACIAGLMFTPEDEIDETTPLQWLLSGLSDAIPGYKDLMGLLPS